MPTHTGGPTGTGIPGYETDDDDENESDSGGFDAGEMTESAFETTVGAILPGGEAITGGILGGAAQLGYQNVDETQSLATGENLPSTADNPARQDYYERSISDGDVTTTNTSAGSFQLPSVPEENQLQTPDPATFRTYLKIAVVGVIGFALLYLLQPILKIIAGLVGD